MNESQEVIAGSARSKWIRPSLLHTSAMLFFLVVVALHYDRDSGFTRFIHFGDRFAATRLPDVKQAHPFDLQGSAGYDGQFYAQIATRPLLADPALDAALDSPAYRSRRIGLPWFAWLAGAGRTPWILQAYALANVFACLAMAILLLHWIPPRNATALLAWLGCGFGLGVMMSVERALTDLPSALGVALAIFLLERNRPLRGGFVFALALLTRDTSVLAVGALLPARRTSASTWLRASLVVAAALLPLALWAFYVRQRFPGVDSMDGSNFASPFSAMASELIAAYRRAPQNGWAAYVVEVLCVVGLCTQCVFLVADAPRSWRERWWRAGIVFALLFAFLGPAVWQDYPAAARAVIPMTLAFNILLPRMSKGSFVLCLIGNLPAVAGLHYFLAPLWSNLR